MAALVILGGVVLAALGRVGEMATFASDTPPMDLDEVSATDVALLRPPMSLWGYNAQVTEHALRMIARSVTARDVEIASLRRELADLRGNTGAQAARTGDVRAARAGDLPAIGPGDQPVGAPAGEADRTPASGAPSAPPAAPPPADPLAAYRPLEPAVGSRPPEPAVGSRPPEPAVDHDLGVLEPLEFGGDIIGELRLACGAQLKAAGWEQIVTRLDIFLLRLQRCQLRLELLVLGYRRIILRLRDASRQDQHAEAEDAGGGS